MHRYLAMAAAVGLGVGSLAACGSSKKSSSSSGSTTAATAAATTAGGGVTLPATSAGAGGTTINVNIGDTSATQMFLTPSATSAPAGKVTFTVKNTGTKDHEMVVLKTDTAYDQLSVTADTVSEDANVGETGDPALKPGETRSFTVDLSAGKYVLVCNIAKHYASGMRSAFTVS